MIKYDTVDEFIKAYQSELSMDYGVINDNDIDIVYVYISRYIPTDLLSILKSKNNLPSKHDLMIIHSVNIQLKLKNAPKVIDMYNEILSIYKDRENDKIPI